MSGQNKPFSQACENNKRPILEVLQPRLANVQRVLEIGTGTGQHAVFFAGQMPHLEWQTSDLIENHAGILQWMADYEGTNLKAPLVLNVDQPSWPIERADAVFTANTFHIVSWEQVLKLLDGCAQILPVGGQLIVYGPFNENNKFTSDSNAQFDQMLKQSVPHRGIRNRQTVAAEAQQRGLILRDTLELPANNRILIFERI